MRVTIDEVERGAFDFSIRFDGANWMQLVAARAANPPLWVCTCSVWRNGKLCSHSRLLGITSRMTSNTQILRVRVRALRLAALGAFNVKDHINACRSS